MSRLIINGDDLGMNERCSQAIAKAFALGLITHTSAMAGGEYFDRAVETAKEHGFSDRIGIHFNLTEGRPLTAAIADVACFVKDGCFRKGFTDAPRPLSEREREAVAEELSAQAQRLIEAGIAVSHADSHHYIHTFSALAPPVAQVCRAYGIKRIRLNRTFDTPSRPRITADRIDNSFWREHGFITTELFGRMSDVAGSEVPDDLEIMVHPDLDRLNRLIDREGMKDGYPVGTPLTDILGIIKASKKLT